MFFVLLLMMINRSAVLLAKKNLIFWNRRSMSQGRVNIERLNYGVAMLVPKLIDANIIKHYRPIFPDAPQMDII